MRSARIPTAYKLSLGHMEDLTLDSFAYLRFPLALAAVAFLIGAIGTLRTARRGAFLALGLDDGRFFPGRSPGDGHV